MSIVSGTTVCIRYAISYCAIRVAVSAAQASGDSISFRSRTASSVILRSDRSDTLWVREVQHRVSPCAALDALIDAR